jgi:hypothetical protein
MRSRNTSGYLKIGIIALVMGVILGMPVMIAAAAGTTGLSIQGPTGPVAVGEKFSVSVMVQPGEALAGVQFNFGYDPAIIAVDSVIEGNLLNQNHGETIFNSGSIDNLEGTVTGILGVITTPGQTVSEPGSVAIINLSARSSGASYLTLSKAIVGSVDGQPLSLETNDSQVIIDQPPVLKTGGNKTVNEKTVLNFTVSATDADGDRLTFSVSNLPSGAEFNATSHVFSWTPGSSQVGTYPGVQFQVNDGLLTVSEEITITVNHVNQPPVLDSITNKTISEGESISFAVNGSDPDGDNLIYAAANLPFGATFNDATRIFSWTPNYTQSGIFSNIRFEVCDGSLTSSRTLSITVTNVNQPPVLNEIGKKTGKAGAKLSFVISGSDPDGNYLTYSATNLPKGATFNPTTRTFSWTPGTTGTYGNVRFQVSDGKLTDFEYITILISAANKAPVLSPISTKSVKTGSLLSFTVTATDVDGDSLSFSAANLPSGSVFNTTTHVFSWVPASNQKGTYRNVRFSVSDGTASVYKTTTLSVTAGATTTATVAAANKAPSLDAISAKNVKVGITFSFTVTGSDPDGDSLTYSATNLPSGANFNPATRIFTWKPATSQVGTYTNVNFTVSDGTLSSSRAVTITVTR